MTEILAISFKISLVFFMAGNLLDNGVSLEGHR